MKECGAGESIFLRSQKIKSKKACYLADRNTIKVKRTDDCGTDISSKRQFAWLPTTTQPRSKSGLASRLFLQASNRLD